MSDYLSIQQNMHSDKGPRVGLPCIPPPATEKSWGSNFHDESGTPKTARIEYVTLYKHQLDDIIERLENIKRLKAELGL